MIRIETVEPEEQWMTWEEAPEYVWVVVEYANSVGMKLSSDRSFFISDDIAICRQIRGNFPSARLRYARPDELPDFSKFCKVPEGGEWRELASWPDGVLCQCQKGNYYYRQNGHVAVFGRGSKELIQVFDGCDKDFLMVRPCRTTRIVIGGK